MYQFLGNGGKLIYCQRLKVVRNFGGYKHKFSLESGKCSEIGENLKQGGNASLPLGEGRPCLCLGERSTTWGHRSKNFRIILCNLDLFE